MNKHEEKIKSLEEQVQQMERVINELRALAMSGTIISVYSHDINHQISELSMSLTRLLKSVGKVADAGLVQSVINSFEALRDTHAKLSKRVMHGKKELRTISKCLNSISYYYSKFKKSHINFKADLSDADSNAIVPSLEMTEIIHCLLSNAYEAVEIIPHRKKNIVLKVWTTQDEVFVSVENNGPCIPKESMDAIWRAGFSTKKQGLGLGLLFVRACVDSIGGHIEVTSNENNTVFTVSFPRKG